MQHSVPAPQPKPTQSHREDIFIIAPNVIPTIGPNVDNTLFAALASHTSICLFYIGIIL